LVSADRKLKQKADKEIKMGLRAAENGHGAQNLRKSMFAGWGLVNLQEIGVIERWSAGLKDGWRNIAIALIDRWSKRVMASTTTMG
jgi:hypothetical protein